MIPRQGFTSSKVLIISKFVSASTFMIYELRKNGDAMSRCELYN